MVDYTGQIGECLKEVKLADDLFECGDEITGMGDRYCARRKLLKRLPGGKSVLLTMLSQPAIPAALKL
jgi:hypothetical protein